MLQVLRDPGHVVKLSNGEYPPREVRWGQPWQYGTPAYWVEETELAVRSGRVGGGPLSHRLGNDLREEVAACILGGWGMPYEMGLAAFNAVKENVLSRTAVPSASQLLDVLSMPFSIGGKLKRYRFANQRSDRLSKALKFLDTSPMPVGHQAIRDWLLQAPGIGLKTASWVVRNHWDSDSVAILDIHVIRAAIQAGVFDPCHNPTRDYREMEALFLAWAEQGHVHASDLDAVIWAEQAAEARTRAQNNRLA